METESERVEEFKSEIEALKLKAAGGETESRMLLVGVVGLVLGFVLLIVGAIQVSGATSLEDQFAFAATSTLLGLGLAVIGGALFIRYSISRYMRFWLIRLIHEQRSQTDRLVEALGGEPDAE